MSQEDDKRYGLKPLPEIEFCGAEEAKRLNKNYAARRKRYRKKNPLRARSD